MGLKPIVKLLDKCEFQNRVDKSFSDVYLTFLSIIQGVALGILAMEIFGDKDIIGNVNFAFVSRSFISFLIIVVVAYEYTLMVGVFRWSPTIVDALIPFVLGLCEIIPMFHLKDLPWWSHCTGVFFSVGAVTLFNTLCHCRPGLFGHAISGPLRQEFINRGFSVAKDATVHGADPLWQITDDLVTYTVKNEGNQLNIYKEKKDAIWDRVIACIWPLRGNNVTVYRKTRNYVMGDIAIALIAVLVNSIAGPYSPKAVWKSVYYAVWEFVYYIVLLCLAVFIMIRHERFMKDLHESFGFTRRSDPEKG